MLLEERVRVEVLLKDVVCVKVATVESEEQIA